MNKIFFFLVCLLYLSASAQQNLYMPQNVKTAFTNETRSPDGKPGKKYWQNYGRYSINIIASPPSKTIRGTETITYFNRSPNPISRPVIKLIQNIHNPGTARQRTAQPEYLTKGIQIDKFMENGKEMPFGDPGGETWQAIRLSKPVPPGDSVQLSFNWQYDVSDQSGREGKLDSTSFFLAYFYPRVAVLDDVNGWDRMDFTDAQEFYNDFNDYQVSVTVPGNFIVWGTGDLQNAGELLQPTYLEKFNKSFTSDEVINIATQKDILAKNITAKNAANTWRWKASNISDVAFCISDHYVWDAASVVVDKKTGRRASCQSAYIDTAINFHNQVKHIQHSLNWFSNNWPGVPYPFSKSTIIQGVADMEYPMMANDSPQEDDVIQRFIAEHEIAHTYFPFYMGINEHRYGFMDEGWTTAFENMIATTDLGKDAADDFFKQFRVGGWAVNPSEETQIPVITPTNILSGPALGHNEYGKPALAYLALKDMLGDSLFRKCLHGFMERWNGKHPIPWDMFNSFNNLSGKNLNWFWHNWFFSSHYMDLAIDSLLPSKTGYSLRLRNIGGFATPTNISFEYTDGSTEKVHYTAAIWEKDQQSAMIAIPTKKKINFLKADGGIYMDANGKDNTWGTKKEKLVKLSDKDFETYMGVYGSKQIPVKITFIRDGNNLVAEASGQKPITLRALGNDSFDYEEAGLTFTFNTAKGEMTLKQGPGSFVFTKEK
jgi:Peptidase family M1 domain